MNLSVVILTKNEEANLARAIESARPLVDEIVVIDDNSEDGTRTIAQRYGAKVYTRALEQDFAAQRNFGLTKASGRWVLFLDADEEISPELEGEIRQTLATPPANITGYYLPRRDFVWGRQLRHGETGKLSLLRLARKTAGKWHRAVHETWEILGKTRKLRGALNHYPHQTLHEFVEHVRMFSEMHAREHYKAGVRSSVLKIILMPKLKFFKGYVLDLGFLDGLPGFMVAMVMSFHSFLAWSNVWLMQKYKRSQKS